MVATGGGNNMRSMRLSADDASIIKGMLARGDKQQDIAAYFGVNPARVVEIKRGRKFPDAPVAPLDALPPQGWRAPANMPPGEEPQRLDDQLSAEIAGQLEELLRSFDQKWTRELNVTAAERRETNEKIDRLSRRLLDMARQLNLVERPVPPQPSRRQPMAG